MFELKTSEKKLVKMNMNIALFQHTCVSKKNRCIGEFSIDMKTIWNNPCKVDFFICKVNL